METNGRLRTKRLVQRDVAKVQGTISITFLYANNAQQETQKKKYIGIALVKGTQYLCIENDKNLMVSIKET
jgi:hypothetical protein